MSLTSPNIPQNIESLSGFLISKLPSPNPEEENFEIPVSRIESNGVDSQQNGHVFPQHSSQIIDQNTNTFGFNRSISHLPTQIDDNLAENANRH